MSTATKFKHYRALPFCDSQIPSLDVAGWDHVAPLTLTQLMNLFWNLEGITATADYDSTASVSGVTGTKQPRSRVCPTASVFGESASATASFSTDPDIGDDTFTGVSFSARQGSISPDNIIRLFDGASFLGYGVGYASLVESSPSEFELIGSSLASAFAQRNAGRRTLSLLSAVEGEPVGYPTEIYDVQTVTLGGIPLLKLDYAANFGGGFDYTLANVAITSLNFYTY